MKLTKKTYESNYTCRKAKFKFEIAPYGEGFYITAEHSKLDIMYNSLWQK